MRASRIIFLLAAVFAPSMGGAATITLTSGSNFNLAPGSGDPSPDAVNDLSIVTAPECSNIMKLTHINGSSHAYPTVFTYATMTYADALGRSYGTGPYCPDGDGGELFYIKTSDNRFYRVRTIANTSANVQLEYSWLGTGTPTPPNSAFTVTTYDLFANFTDTSTGTPSAWSWSFGDATSSTQQNPRHRYASSGTRGVSLTASNVGGADPTPATQNVMVSERPSILAAGGATLNVDGVGAAEFTVVAGGCPEPFHLETIGANARAALINKDYRNIVAGDITGASFNATNFCAELDYLDGFLVRTDSLAIYRAWIAGNSASGIRLEVALLQAAPPPPPVSSFTFASYDLITEFTDTSTGGASGWSWAFGDGATSTSASPSHRYASAGTRSACLTASNVGGPGNTTCQSVSTSLVPSTTVATNGSFDLDVDLNGDLQVLSAAGACGGISNKLRPLGASAVQTLSKDYRNVVVGDINPLAFSTSDFCVDVDFRQPFLVRTTSSQVYKAWTAGNDAGGIRLQFAFLAAVSPVIFQNGFE